MKIWVVTNKEDNKVFGIFSELNYAKKKIVDTGMVIKRYTLNVPSEGEPAT